MMAEHPSYGQFACPLCGALFEGPAPTRDAYLIPTHDTEPGESQRIEMAKRCAGSGRVGRFVRWVEQVEPRD